MQARGRGTETIPVLAMQYIVLSAGRLKKLAHARRY